MTVGEKEIIAAIRQEAKIRSDSKMVAYRKEWLPSMMGILGDFCKFGVHHFGYDLSLWFGLFARSGVSRYFCTGAPALEGTSGMTMAQMVDDIYRGNKECFFPETKSPLSSMPKETIPQEKCSVFGEYMAWYQWYSNMDFNVICEQMRPAEALALSQITDWEGNGVYLFASEFERKAEKFLC